MQLLALFLVPHSTIPAQANVFPIISGSVLLPSVPPSTVLGSRGICTVDPKLSAWGFPLRQLLLLDIGSVFIALNLLELCVFYQLELEGLIYSSPEIIFISFTQVHIFAAFFFELSLLHCLYYNCLLEHTKLFPIVPQVYWLWVVSYYCIKAVLGLDCWLHTYMIWKTSVSVCALGFPVRIGLVSLS